MGGFFDWVGDVASDIWGGISSTAGDIWGGISGLFGAGEDTGDVGGVFGEPSWPDVSWPEVGFPSGGGQTWPAPSPPGPADVVLRGDDMNGYGGGGMVPVGVGGAVAAGGLWLGSLLARSLGRGAAGAVFSATNGVRVRMSQLWPLVKRYGSEAVAAGLGISAGALGTLLATPEALHGRSGRRGRGKGISARDVKTTRRTLKTIRKLYHMMPTRRSSSSGYRPYYRRRR